MSWATCCGAPTVGGRPRGMRGCAARGGRHRRPRSRRRSYEEDDDDEDEEDEEAAAEVVDSKGDDDDDDGADASHGPSTKSGGLVIEQGGGVQIQHQPALRRAKRSDFQLELTIADKDDSPGFVCNKQLLVTEVEEDMEAERCGVCKGMRLVGFGGRRFTSREFVWGNARKIRWKHVKDMSRKIQLPHTYMFDSRMADVLEVPRHGLHVRGYGYVVIDQAEPVDVLNALRRHLTQLGVRPCDKRRVAKCFGAHRHRDIVSRRHRIHPTYPGCLAANSCRGACIACIACTTARSLIACAACLLCSPMRSQ
jgi:hypothetical protein